MLVTARFVERVRIRSFFAGNNGHARATLLDRPIFRRRDELRTHTTPTCGPRHHEKHELGVVSVCMENRKALNGRNADDALRRFRHQDDNSIRTAHSGESSYDVRSRGWISEFPEKGLDRGSIDD